MIAIIIFVIIVLIIIFIYSYIDKTNKNIENFTTDEAIANVSSIYNTNNMKVDNLSTNSIASVDPETNLIELNSLLNCNKGLNINGNTNFNSNNIDLVGNISSSSLTTNEITNKGITNLSGYTTLMGGTNDLNWQTHLPYKDGTNYIRGNTIIEKGSTKIENLIVGGNAELSNAKLNGNIIINDAPIVGVSTLNWYDRNSVASAAEKFKSRITDPITGKLKNAIEFILFDDNNELMVMLPEKSSGKIRLQSVMSSVVYGERF